MLRREAARRGLAWLVVNAAFGTALALKAGLPLALVVEGLVVTVSAMTVLVSRSTESRVMVFCSATSVGYRGRFGRTRAYSRSDVGFVTPCICGPRVWARDGSCW
jgi:hypothetical protein